MIPANLTKIRGKSTDLDRLQDNIGNVLTPLAQAVAKTPIGGSSPPAWIAPSLLVGWANTGTGAAVAGYHKDALGYVHVKGTITNTTGAGLSSNLFVFPAGFRPNEAHEIPAFGTAGATAVILVNTGGLRPAAAIGAGSNIALAFSFLAEQ